MEPTMSQAVKWKAAAPLRWAEVVRIDDGRIQAHLDEVVRSTVEETLNALLDAEADHLCGARRYEAQRRAQGHPGGQLYAAAARRGRRPVSLQVPKLRGLPLRDGDHRALSQARVLHVEEALIEMYLAG